MSHDTQAAAFRHLPVKLIVLAALALAAVSAVFASAASANDNPLSGVVTITNGKASPTKGALPAGGSYFELVEGSTLPPNYTDTPTSGDYPTTTALANSSSPPNNPNNPNYTLLVNGTVGLTLGSFDSDNQWNGGDILDPQAYDGADFDLYSANAVPSASSGGYPYGVGVTLPSPELSYSSSPGKESGNYPYSLEGVSGYLLTNSDSDLRSLGVNWYTAGVGNPATQYNQGANDSGVSGVPAAWKTKGVTEALDTTAAGLLAGSSSATPNKNLLGVYNPTTKAVAFEYSSVVNNNSSAPAGSFNGDFGVWYFVGSL